MELRWIWAEGSPEEQNRHILFRQTFTLQTLPAFSEIAIAVNDQYVLSVNGSFADCGNWNDWPGYQAYDTLDITSLLREGENTLEILAYRQGKNTMQRAASASRAGWRVSADGLTLAESGTDVMYCDETGYENGPDTEITNFQMGFSFAFDARKACPSLRRWKHAVPAAAPHTLFARPLKKCTVGDPLPSGMCNFGLFLYTAGQDAGSGTLMQTALIRPLEFTPLFGDQPRTEENAYIDAPLPLPSDTGYRIEPGAFGNGSENGFYMIIDWGCEEAGFPYLDLEAPAGTVIDVGYGEHLDDGRCRTQIGGSHYSFRYTACGERQSFCYRLRRIAGRYLQLFVHSRGEGFALYNASLCPVEYPLEPRGMFTSDDRLAERIWDVSRKTLSLCMHEHYEDCPWREQSLYGMDSRNQALSGYYAFGEYVFPAASFDLMGRGLREDSHLWITSPTGSIPGVPGCIPSFDLAWAVECGELALYSGDPELIHPLEEPLCRVLEGFASRVKDGVLYNDRSPKPRDYWHFYEWSSGMGGDGNTGDGEAEAPLNAFFIKALEYGAIALRLVGLEEKACGFESLAQTVRAAFHKAFWDAGKAAYRTAAERQHYSELTQALALWAEAVPAEVQKPLRRRLATKNSGLVALTISHFIYKTDALMQEPDVYADYIRDTISDLWGLMLSQGATSFWETIGGGDAFNKAGSLCHGWSGIPVYFYARYVLGICPETPGFRTFSFRPRCPGLHASGTVPTPAGDIIVENGELKSYPSRLRQI